MIAAVAIVARHSHALFQKAERIVVECYETTEPFTEGKGGGGPRTGAVFVAGSNPSTLGRSPRSTMGGGKPTRTSELAGEYIAVKAPSIMASGTFLYLRERTRAFCEVSE